MFTWKQLGREERPGGLHRARAGPSTASFGRERKQIERFNKRMKCSRIAPVKSYQYFHNGQSTDPMPNRRHGLTPRHIWPRVLH